MEKDEFTRSWIISNSVEIVSQYEKGVLTIRGLHYQLVSIGMTNTIRHYKRVVSALIHARWDGLIDFDTFSDNDREMIGTTSYEETVLYDKTEEAKRQLELWMTTYSKNKWENQIYYPEVFIEKKALQGVFAPICKELNVYLGACKGYPSLTFLHDAYIRFKAAIDSGKVPVILYFGDYDPSGDDIPRSMKENLWNFGVDIEFRRIALVESQVDEMNLPYAPAKVGDSRTKKWKGKGQVELDAIKPEMLQSMCRDSVMELFDSEKYDELLIEEESESNIYQKKLRDFVNNEL